MCERGVCERGVLVGRVYERGVCERGVLMGRVCERGVCERGVCERGVCEWRVYEWEVCECGWSGSEWEECERVIVNGDCVSWVGVCCVYHVYGKERVRVHCSCRVCSVNRHC